MADGESDGDDFFEVEKVEAQPFVDVPMRVAGGPIGIVCSVAESSALCEKRRHVGSSSLWIVEMLMGWKMVVGYVEYWLVLCTGSVVMSVVLRQATGLLELGRER